MISARTQKSHVDDRGYIRDIIQFGSFEHATLIHSVAGARRGDHYHRESTQTVYVLSGALTALTGDDQGRLTDVRAITAGDILVHEPNESHALVAATDATFLVLTTGPRGGDNYEVDTYRLSHPLGSDTVWETSVSEVD